MDYLERAITFYGDELLTFLEKETGKIYISVRHICTGLGMNKSQRDAQVKKVNNDSTLKGALKLTPLKTNGGIQKILLIELEFLTIWLVKINPVRFDEKLKDKLLKYQLYCKDVLSNVFFGKREKEEEIKYNPSLRDMNSEMKVIETLEEKLRVTYRELIASYSRVGILTSRMLEIHAKKKEYLYLKNWAVEKGFPKGTKEAINKHFEENGIKRMRHRVEEDEKGNMRLVEVKE